MSGKTWVWSQFSIICANLRVNETLANIWASIWRLQESFIFAKYTQTYNTGATKVRHVIDQDKRCKASCIWDSSSGIGEYIFYSKSSTRGYNDRTVEVQLSKCSFESKALTAWVILTIIFKYLKTKIRVFTRENSCTSKESCASGANRVPQNFTPGGWTLRILSTAGDRSASTGTCMSKESPCPLPDLHVRAGRAIEAGVQLYYSINGRQGHWAGGFLLGQLLLPECFIVCCVLQLLHFNVRILLTFVSVRLLVFFPRVFFFFFSEYYGTRICAFLVSAAFYVHTFTLPYMRDYTFWHLHISFYRYWCLEKSTDWRTITNTTDTARGLLLS